jgi:hypothetical protein
MTRVRNRVSVGRGILIFLTSAAFASEAAAQCCANYNEFAAACRASGRIPMPAQPGSPLRCRPRSDGGSETAAIVAGSLDAAMMSAAGQLGTVLGTALGTMIGQALFGQQQDAQADALSRQYEAQLALRLVREEQEARTRRNQALLASLQGRIGHTELALRHVETQQLQLRSVDDMFGIPGRAAGTTNVDVAVVGPTPPLSPPPTPLSSEQLATLDRAETLFVEARNRNAEATALVDEGRRRVELATRIRVEAQQHAEAARSAPPVVAAPGATAAPADDALAEAQRLLREATEIEGRANRDMADAQRQAEVASRELSQADTARQRIVGASGSPAATAPLSPRP